MDWLKKLLWKMRGLKNKVEFFKTNEKEIKAVTTDPDGKIIQSIILECFPPQHR
jgi:hypothetical protein